MASAATADWTWRRAGHVWQWAVGGEPQVTVIYRGEIKRYEVGLWKDGRFFEVDNYYRGGRELKARLSQLGAPLPWEQSR